MLKSTKDLDSGIYRDALAIRRKVFMEEQEVSEALEIDEDEGSCLHLVWYEGDKALCTARLLPRTEGLVKIQRVAVLKEARGLGLGAKIMREAEALAREMGAKRLKLGAQNHAIAFYEKLGFSVCSEEYLDAGILHHDMEKDLSHG
ncbi:MAG: GNAT family N-acetyltransferase [Cardiobacteriaceae bacterium]|nr:GNAT family N-acetyltransferase [Cardiobacteriaceae bacterium]